MSSGARIGKSGQPRRLLFLMPFPLRSDADHGGGRVAWSIVSALAQRHQIAVVCLRPQDAQPSEAPADSIDVHDVPHAISSDSFARLGRLMSLASGTPLWASYTWSSPFATRARQVASTWKPDIIHFEYHVMGQYASALDAVPAARVLTEYEPGVLAAREHMAPGSGRLDIRAWLERRAWHRFEARVIGEMSAVIVFTELDRHVIAGFGQSAPVVCIPFRLQGRAKPPLTPSADQARLLFVGNFIHPPNVDAAIRLAFEIFPIIRAVRPDARLDLVGAHPPAAVKRAEGTGVRVWGRVPDVGEHLKRATVVVVPIRQGGGMRVKMIEALAAGKPVIASRLAAEGLSLRDGVNVVLAETNEAFAQAVVNLLGDQQRRQGIARAAYEWARAGENAPDWIDQYDALYNGLSSHISTGAV